MTETEDRDTLLLVTPVETARRDANGWSSAVRRALVVALARTGDVAAAARQAGGPRTTTGWPMSRRAVDRNGDRALTADRDAIMLLDEATELPNGRDMCVTSPAPGQPTGPLRPVTAA